jgi:hypothetical protein
MADEFSAEAPDFGRLARDITKAADGTLDHARTALEVTGGKIREDWKQSATGLAHAPRFPYSISSGWAGRSHGGGALGAFVGGSGKYDLEMEIGPDKDRPQGSLGNLIEYGSVNNPPMGLGHGALQRNEADFEHGIDRAVEDALREAGL